MIRYVSDFWVADNLRESMQAGRDGFPFSASELNVIEYVNNCAKWHWHGFVEFAYVVDGALECCTSGGTFTVQPGEGYYINANALHMVRKAANATDVKYRVLQFETALLSGSEIVDRRYIAPIVRSEHIPVVRLSPRVPTQCGVLEEMAQLFRIAAREPQPYELRVMNSITSLWTLLYELMAPQLGESVPVDDATSSRVKRMLSYIHAHYMEPMSVADIADAANISKREAYRCFQSLLGTTPALYVLQHRVNAGARLLMETGRSITEISLDCGFSSPSYFCKAFHDLTGSSPRDFRKANG